MATNKGAIRRIIANVPPLIERGRIVAVNRLSGTVDVRIGSSQTARKRVKISDTLQLAQVGLNAICLVTSGNDPIVIAVNSSKSTEFRSFSRTLAEARIVAEPDTGPDATMRASSRDFNAAGRYVSLTPIGDGENTIQAIDAAQALRLVGSLSKSNIFEVMVGEAGYPLRHHIDGNGIWWIGDRGEIRSATVTISSTGIRVYNVGATQYRELTVAGLSEVQDV
jgi:hypothetical protein